MQRSPSEAPVHPGASRDAGRDASPTAGLCARVALEVAESDTAVALGTGDVAVLATPHLVSLCEEASYRAVTEHLGPGKTSVASRVQFDHLVPVPVGSTVTAEATLERVEGRRLVFTVSVTLRAGERTGLVGAGRLTRVMVDRETFLSKVAACAPAAGAAAGSSAGADAAVQAGTGTGTAGGTKAGRSAHGACGPAAEPGR